MVNLGNVAGVVIGENPPLEADGITVKTYVLWGQPITGQAGQYVVRYWNTTTGQWLPLDPASIIDDNMASNSIVGNKTFSKVKILQLINGVNKTVPYGQFTIYKAYGNTGTVREAGDVIMGLWDVNRFVNARFNGGDENDENDYTFFVDNDLTI